METLIFNTKEAFSNAIVEECKKTNNNPRFVSMRYISKEKGTKTRPDNYLLNYAFGIINFIYFHKLLKGIEAIKDIDIDAYNTIMGRINGDKARAWGEHLADARAIIEYNGNRYLEMNVWNSKRIAGESIKTPSPSITRETELSKLTKMFLRDFSLSNVISINMCHKIYMSQETEKEAKLLF